MLKASIIHVLNEEKLMKVKIKKYPQWWGSEYTLGRIFSWAKKENKYGFFEMPEPLSSFISWYAETPVGKVHNSVANKLSAYQGSRRVKVKLDPWDSWNVDETVGHIALPLLKQLKEAQHGASKVDDEDVPHMYKHGYINNESLQPDLFQSEEQDALFWNQSEARWTWVLDEMIFAFESIVGTNEDWESKYFNSTPPNVKGWQEEAARINNGFRLFGKYYRALWD
jgi:hypothetical protein